MNKVKEMFNLDAVKHEIENCPADEIVILCGHWSINQPKYDDPEELFWDMDEFGDEIGCMLMVNDYDDLIVDPHGIIE